MESSMPAHQPAGLPGKKSKRRGWRSAVCLGIAELRGEHGRGARLLVHKHELAERLGRLLWNLETLEGRRRGILEAGNRVLRD